ncbi:uncharacterized protein Z518_04976 [Rhinocladiella mackenziei CBS 650.93]|uniref:Uncharacterized protein n=1 Tax=Rhinocladiella mackenziei CBS 650.93 TaxID=1442369 RepID=A0A0D2JD12_9EURO|nr:uncharacterized protein Z518_04976 [Rhinocladiella mackenziei CBS 650.93]KIX07000.1 hypothetical protein Z518_04976 [Rhinocladiella mackenziei CBS 650.93]
MSETKKTYEEFFIEKDLGFKSQSGLPRVSFPISSSSKEAVRYDKALPGVKRFLNQQNFDWESISCVGRSSWGPSEPVKSTIFIMGKNPATEDLKKDAQQKSEEEHWGLPMEFIEGAIEEGATYTSCFGFLGKNAPITPGSSCGNLKLQGSGTIGGFITLKGNPRKRYIMERQEPVAALVAATGTSEDIIKRLKEASSKDIQLLRGILDNTKNITKEPAMASVWVSSGTWRQPQAKPKLDPYHSDYIKEDWAITRVFPNVKVNNTFHQNVLQPLAKGSAAEPPKLLGDKKLASSGDMG